MRHDRPSGSVVETVTPSESFLEESVTSDKIVVAMMSYVASRKEGEIYSVYARCVCTYTAAELHLNCNHGKIKARQKMAEEIGERSTAKRSLRAPFIVTHRATIKGLAEPVGTYFSPFSFFFFFVRDPRCSLSK